jgi:hypothetical protein
MTRRSAAPIALVALTLLTGGLDSRPVAAQGSAPWTTLFDGKTLNGWNRVGDANWEVADGTIQATKGAASFLVTPDNYTDFQIQLEFWVSGDANSGVFIRCEDPKTITAANAYEVNIIDKRPDPSYRTGSIVDVAKPLVMLDTGGKWNTFDITARGPRMTVVLNGMKTAEVDHSGHKTGPIALQYGAGTVRFRNIRVRRF